jgi:uncharacterized protein YecT (DUF1311 family)
VRLRGQSVAVHNGSLPCITARAVLLNIQLGTLMRSSRGLLLAVLLLALSPVALAVGSAAEQCFNLSSHAEARACLATRERESAAVVGRTEDAFRTALASWDQESSFRTRARANFDASAEAFRRYRAAQCELHASLAAGGNATGDRRLLCTIELNEQRAAQLQNEMGTLK